MVVRKCKLVFLYCQLQCPPLAAAIALAKEKKKFKETDTYFEFNVIEVASTLGWNSGIAKRELKNLEWAGTNFDNEGVFIPHRSHHNLVQNIYNVYYMQEILRSFESLEFSWSFVT
jgi:hypothetical protein